MRLLRPIHPFIAYGAGLAAPSHVRDPADRARAARQLGRERADHRAAASRADRAVDRARLAHHVRDPLSSDRALAFHFTKTMAIANLYFRGVRPAVGLPDAAAADAALGRRRSRTGCRSSTRSTSRSRRSSGTCRPASLLGGLGMQVALDRRSATAVALGMWRLAVRRYSAVGELMRPLRLVWLYVRLGVMNELQYRANFFIAAVPVAALRSASGSPCSRSCTRTRPTLNGWTQSELLVIVGVQILLGGVIHATHPAEHGAARSTRCATASSTSP